MYSFLVSTQVPRGQRPVTSNSIHMDNRAEFPTLENLQQQNNELAQQLVELSAKLKWCEEQFRLAQQKRFGASSEKTNSDQMELNLFNEAEVLATP